MNEERARELGRRLLASGRGGSAAALLPAAWRYLGEGKGSA